MMWYTFGMKEELAKIHQARQTEDFSGIDFGVNEVVEHYVKRSKMGLIMIWGGEIIAFILLTVLMVAASRSGGGLIMPLNEEAKKYLNMIFMIMYGVLILSALIGTAVYKANAIIITNKRAIQKTRTALFARSLNVIELSSIEDVSFAQKSILDQIFRLGTLRMSTVGDETTYTLTYVDSSSVDIKKIAKLVHDAKSKKRSKKA